VVAYREEETALAAIVRLKTRLQRRQAKCRLPKGLDGRATALALVERLGRFQGEVLHVLGWEKSFGQGDVAANLYDLNFLREEVAFAPRVQVWWMPVTMRDALMRFAPDTWSVVDLRLALADEDEYVELHPIVAERVRRQLRRREGVRLFQGPVPDVFGTWIFRSVL